MKGSQLIEIIGSIEIHGPVPEKEETPEEGKLKLVLITTAGEALTFVGIGSLIRRQIESYESGSSMTFERTPSPVEYNQKIRFVVPPDGATAETYLSNLLPESWMTAYRQIAQEIGDIMIKGAVATRKGTIITNPAGYFKDVWTQQLPRREDTLELFLHLHKVIVGRADMIRRQTGLESLTFPDLHRNTKIFIISPDLARSLFFKEGGTFYLQDQFGTQSISRHSVPDRATPLIHHNNGLFINLIQSSFAKHGINIKKFPPSAAALFILYDLWLEHGAKQEIPIESHQTNDPSSENVKFLIEQTNIRNSDSIYKTYLRVRDFLRNIFQAGAVVSYSGNVINFTEEDMEHIVNPGPGVLGPRGETLRIYLLRHGMTRVDILDYRRVLPERIVKQFVTIPPEITNVCTVITPNLLDYVGMEAKVPIYHYSGAYPIQLARQAYWGLESILRRHLIFGQVEQVLPASTMIDFVLAELVEERDAKK